MSWIVKKLLGFIGSQKFLSIQLDITNVCNLNCLHCYQVKHSSGEDLSFQDWRRILDQYGKLAEKLCLKPHFCISGGEPTLSPIFSNILTEINSRWPDAGIVVLTNGTAISEEIASVMAKYKVAVQISLDGPDSARHDFIRGAGRFDKALEGYKTLRGLGLNVTFQTVLSNRTAQWITEFFELAEKMNAAAMDFTRFMPQGKGKSFCEISGERSLLGVELKDAYSKILSASQKSSISTVTDLPLFTLISPELGAHGKFGFQGLVIDYQGNLKVSSRADIRLGNILKTGGLEELFLHHPVMKDLRDGKVDQCGPCRFYDKCGGDRNASFAAHGSFLKKDPGCWL